jgi:hypothetical protein
MKTNSTMKRYSLYLLIFILVLQMFAVPSARAAGNTYYVATHGNDSNNGQFATPFRTIQKAADVAQAGDTVYVRGGTYNEKVIVKNSGSAGNYITFSAYDNETATIDVSGKSFGNYHEGGFTVSGRNYVKVIGFRVVNVPGGSNGGFGIVCYQSNYCIVQNNSTYNTYRSGIMSRSSTNVTIDGNDIALANNGGNQEMLAVSGGSNITVTNNRVYDGGWGTGESGYGGEGINVYSGATNVLVRGNEVYNNKRVGIYIDAYDKTTSNITIDGNKVYNNRSGISVEAEQSAGVLSNLVISNNLVYQNKRSGIILGDWGLGSLSGIRIVNNTVAMNGTHEWGGGIALWNNRAANVIVRNNILSQNSDFTLEVKGTPLSQVTISHNLYDGYKGLSTEKRGTNPVDSSAGFVNASTFDFRLRSNSAAINKGTKTNAPVYDHSPKLRESSVDIGAYELADILLSSDFNSSFSGWAKSGSVKWSTAKPRIGAKAVHLVGKAAITRAVSTQGYENIRLEVYLGAKSYEGKEKLQLQWWDGSAWKTLTTIKNGSKYENGKLNRMTFALPAAAANRTDLKIRIRQISADKQDFGYIDSIQVSGTSIP